MDDLGRNMLYKWAKEKKEKKMTEIIRKCGNEAIADMQLNIGKFFTLKMSKNAENENTILFSSSVWRTGSL